jgi:hypothetical protein
MCPKCHSVGGRLKNLYHCYGQDLERVLKGDQPLKYKGWSAGELARAELDTRIRYEYLFDRLQDEHLEGRQWLDVPTRDKGHNIRIKKLARISCN